jgi:protein-disulfide isomerase
MPDDSSTPGDATSEAGTPYAAEPLTAPRPPEPMGRRTFVVVGVLVGLAALVAVGIWILSTRADDGTAADLTGVSDVDDIAATPLDEGMSFASGAGPIVDIYVDYQCGHCADLEEVIGDELASMVAAEEVELVLRPVKFLSRASGRGAAALYCAADAGRAYDMHQLMLSDLAADFSPEGLTASAAELGLDGEDFGACMADRETTAWVNGVTDTAVSEGIEATPSVFVDGTRLSSAELDSAAAFRAAVLDEGA